MTARKPSKPWRLVLPGGEHKLQRSENATREAVEAEKDRTDANLIIIQHWENGRWEEWLRWVRNDNGWSAE